MFSFQLQNWSLLAQRWNYVPIDTYAVVLVATFSHLKISIVLGLLLSASVIQIVSSLMTAVKTTRKVVNM